MSESPPDINPVQTAADAARQLNSTETLVRKAQASRKDRGEAYAKAKALYKQEFRKARLSHRDASSDKVRDDLANDSDLDAAAQIEAADIAKLAGFDLADRWRKVADLELLMDLAKEGRDGAKDAVQVWERWGSQWQSVVGWCRDDASREMGGGRKPLRAVSE